MKSLRLVARSWIKQGHSGRISFSLLFQYIAVLMLVLARGVHKVITRGNCKHATQDISLNVSLNP